MKAVIYIRVSSQEQVSNLSLPLQERTCRDYCEGQGWQVVHVYREEGESAKTADRTQLKRLLSDVRTKGYADTLVVYSVSRLARDTYSHLAIKAHLARKGLSLRSVTEPLDDTATGKLMENILASMAQWDNDVRSERTTAGMQEAIRRGRWVWKAPLGYRNVVRADGTKSIDPDEREAPLVEAAFELAATGLYSLGAIAERLHRRGLCGRRSGQALSPETLRRLLRHPVHAGRLTCRTWNVEQPGDWTPIVERELWVRVQAVLGRSVPSRAPYQSAHPDFPLRRFVRCGGCQQPLTGSWTKGRNGRYAYYRCTSCNRSVAKATLEQDFAELLKGLRPEPELLKLWRAIVLDVWREHTARADTDRKQQRDRLARIAERKEKLVKAYVYESAVDRETYERLRAELDEELLLAELAVQETEIESLDVEGALAFCSQILDRADRIWEESSLDQRQRFQRLVFPEGLSYSQETGFGTPTTALIFSILRTPEAPASGVVAHTGFEPVLPA